MTSKSPTQGGSFIPNRSTGKIGKKRFSKRIYLFSYLSNVIFFATLLSVIGIFFIQRQTNIKLNTLITVVDEERQSVDRSQIDKVSRLDNRIKTAQQILNWHNAPSVLFDELESLIVSPIQLTNFSYLRETGKPVELTIIGNADTFDALLFQRDSMSSNKILASAEITDILYSVDSLEGDLSRRILQANTLNDTAKITFVIKNKIDANKIGYEPRYSLEEVPKPPIENININEATTTSSTTVNNNLESITE